MARLFCDVELAGRIERAEAGLISALARATHDRTGTGDGFVTAIGGGVASFAEADSPFTKVAGVGFGGVPGEAEWAAVEHAFAARGAATQVELAHLAYPEIAPVLSDRGYWLGGTRTSSGSTSARCPSRCCRPVSRCAAAAPRSSSSGSPWWSRRPSTRTPTGCRGTTPGSGRRSCYFLPAPLSGQNRLDAGRTADSNASLFARPRPRERRPRIPSQLDASAPRRSCARCRRGSSPRNLPEVEGRASTTTYDSI
jgi:hypothetical protein